MLSLQGRLTSSELSLVRDKTKILFKDYDAFKTPEAVVIHEQNIMSDEELLKACCEEYGFKVKTPRREYIPRAMVEMFRQTKAVPIHYTAMTNTMEVGVLPEVEPNFRELSNIFVKEVKVPVHYYVELHKAYYGNPDFILPLPTKDNLEFIYAEALTLKAADITIFNVTKEEAEVIYNVRKRLVHSRRKLTGDQVLEIAKLLATSGRSTFDACNEELTCITEGVL